MMVFLSDLDSIEKRLRELDEIHKETVIEKGMLLKRVKDNDLTHGQWLSWLRSFGIQPRTAQRYIQCYEQFGNTTCASQLSSGLMFDLLSLPANVDRESFVTKPQEVPEKGGRKLVTEMSQKERRAVVRAARIEAGLVKQKVEAEGSKLSPYISRMIKTLENMEPPIVDLLETGKLSIEQALDLGKLSGKRQLEFIQIYERYQPFLVDNDPLDEFIKLIVSGFSKSTIERMINASEKVDEMLERYSDNQFIVMAIEQLISSFETDYADEKATLKSIKKLLDELEKIVRRMERERRQRFYSISPYRVLEVSSSASQDEIRKRYRDLAKKYHPDNYDTGDADIFMRITRAYDELSKGVAAV